MRSLLCLPLLCLPLLVACAASPLIRPGDPDFERAQERLVRVAEQVRAEAASPREAALFLQAEAFFGYRYQLRLHGARSYAAQTLAAVLDFGPFSALAAGNGVADLRLQMYDGAAQLYEAHLARYPQSKLRPLALWRLGFAYRAGAADGFPRDEGQALAELVSLQDPTLSPLAALAQKVPWKSQDTAVGLSVLPGLGQIYAGETWNGVVRMVLAAAFATVFALPLVQALQHDSLGWKRIAVSTAGFIGLQVVYSTAFQDAQRAALEFDERQEAAFLSAHPEAP